VIRIFRLILNTNYHISILNCVYWEENLSKFTIYFQLIKSKSNNKQYDKIKLCKYIIILFEKHDNLRVFMLHLNVYKVRWNMLWSLRTHILVSQILILVSMQNYISFLDFWFIFYLVIFLWISIEKVLIENILIKDNLTTIIQPLTVPFIKCYYEGMVTIFTISTRFSCSNIVF